MEKSIYPMCDEQIFDNPFEEESNNSKKIMALLLVQTDILRETLTDRQKDVVRTVIIENRSQREAAKLMSLSESTVNRALRAAIAKMRRYLHYCELAIRYYEQTES